MEKQVNKKYFLIRKASKHLEKKENYKSLRIREVDIIKQMEMKEKVRKGYLRRTRKRLETKLCSRNLIKGINMRAVSIVK